jgi:hypothetical protein
MVGVDVFRKRDKSLAPDGLLHKYIVLIYTNCIKIVITLNAKSAVLRITVISDLLFTSNIGHTKISYSSLNKTDIQHKPDTHGEYTSKEHVDI